jgi:hypothetical protein
MCISSDGYPSENVFKDKKEAPLISWDPGASSRIAIYRTRILANCDYVARATQVQGIPIFIKRDSGSLFSA